MRAFIIAGGEGTRLRPYTYSTPKPMLRLGGKPILEYVIENLRRWEIKNITITVGYLHQQIIDYFGDGSKFGVKIDYIIEKKYRGTAGALSDLKGKIKEPFFVLMGDHITNIDLKKMHQSHKKSQSIATIALFKSRTQIDFGVATRKDEYISGFVEKPLLEHEFNTGIYLFEPSVLDFVEDGNDFAKNVFPKLLSKKEKIGAYPFDDVWFDIGRVADYDRLVELFSVIKFFRDVEGKI